MAAKQEILLEIINNEFGVINGNYLSVLEINNHINEGLQEEVIEVYRELGGVLIDIPVRFGKWDIVTRDFIVELDEEQHFNRYRKITLKSSFYQNHTFFNVDRYKLYCDAYEDNCLRKASFGKYWTSPSTEKQFGNPGENRDLGGSGSPRWKQRAFYDFLRDIYSRVYEIPVIRLSIYDNFQVNNDRCLLEEILDRKMHEFYPQIITFIVNLLKPLQ